MLRARTKLLLPSGDNFLFFKSARKCMKMSLISCNFFSSFSSSTLSSSLPPSLFFSSSFGSSFRAAAKLKVFEGGFLLTARRNIKIGVERTPNPNAKMFLPEGVAVLPEDAPDTLSFTSIQKCQESPLAERLLQLNGVQSVLLSGTYITIVKQRNADWKNLENAIIFEIDRHLEADGLIYIPEKASSTSAPSFIKINKEEKERLEKKKEKEKNEEEKEREKERAELSDGSLEEIVDAIKLLIETRARPMVRDDGGDVEFMKFDQKTGTVWIYMKGSCEGCPSSVITVQQGISQMLKHFIPEVECVKQCDEFGDPLSDVEDNDNL